MNRVSMIRLGWDKIVDDSVWAILNLGVGILGFGNIYWKYKIYAI